jgi:hypothetical protein
MFLQITLKGNDTGSTLDVTVEDPDLTEVIVFVAGIQRGKIYSVRIAAYNVIGLGPYSEPFHLELDTVHYDENELAVGNSTRYTWLIALFGSLLFMLILVMSVLVYYRKRNMYHRKTMASHQVLCLPMTMQSIIKDTDNYTVGEPRYSQVLRPKMISRIKIQ